MPGFPVAFDMYFGRGFEHECSIVLQCSALACEHRWSDSSLPSATSFRLGSLASLVRASPWLVEARRESSVLAARSPSRRPGVRRRAQFRAMQPRNSRSPVVGPRVSFFEVACSILHSKVRTTSSFCLTASLLSLCVRPGRAIATGRACGVSVDPRDTRDAGTVWWAPVLPDADVAGGPDWACTSQWEGCDQ